jgi:hypothetical protein
MNTATPHITLGGSIRRLVSLALLVTSVLAAAIATPAGTARASSTLPPYGWPVKPFGMAHPVRGSLGDPRTVFVDGPSRRTLMTGGGSFSFHFGIDVSAPNGTAVYPVEFGTVTTVSRAKAREYVEVAGPNGRSFQYWHIVACVAPGQHVAARATVLGHILRPAGHVHLAELDHGIIVNPLAPGHLEPYTDTTVPAVTAIRFSSSDTGSGLAVGRVSGRVEIVASARDLPTLPVPGAWNGLPVTPALLAWSIRSATGAVVSPRRVVYDVRNHLPAASAFWQIYARGTHQNMTTFGTHYSFGEPGTYLFRLAPGGFDTHALPDGAYRLVVTATDIRGNHGTLVQQFSIRNR